MWKQLKLQIRVLRVLQQILKLVQQTRYVLELQLDILKDGRLPTSLNPGSKKPSVEILVAMLKYYLAALRALGARQLIQGFVQ